VTSSGGGFRCAVGLPAPLRAADAIERREELAEAFGVSASRLSVTGAGRRVVVLIGDAGRPEGPVGSDVEGE